MTILITTHGMDEADELCDELAIMHLGKVAAHRQARRTESRPSGPKPRSTTSSRISAAARFRKEEAIVTSARLDAQPAAWAEPSAVVASFARDVGHRRMSS